MQPYDVHCNYMHMSPIRQIRWWCHWATFRPANSYFSYCGVGSTASGGWASAATKSSSKSCVDARWLSVAVDPFQEGDVSRRGRVAALENLFYRGASSTQGRSLPPLMLRCSRGPLLHFHQGPNRVAAELKKIYKKPTIWNGSNIGTRGKRRRGW